MLDMPPPTPRNIAKFIVKASIAEGVAHVTKEAVANYTAFDSDNAVVKIGAKCVGWYLSSKVQPYTDAAVDKTADYIETKREERRQARKKSEESK